MGYLIQIGAYAAAVLSLVALLSMVVRLIRSLGRITDRIDAVEKETQRLAGVTNELVRHELRRRDPNGGARSDPPARAVVPFVRRSGLGLYTATVVGVCYC